MAIFLVMFVSNANAYNYSLNINGKSKHLDTTEKFNENNLGLGVLIEEDNQFLTAGVYKNSVNRPSYYIGTGIQKPYGNKLLYFKPGILVGLVSGYDATLVPMVLPLVSIGNSTYGAINVMYAPKVNLDRPAMVMFTYSIPIN